jgi:type III secretion protein L
MAVWLRTGELEVGVDDGVVRRDEFAALVEVCHLNQRAAERLAHAGEEAARIVADALQQAEQQIAHAQDESDRIRAEARERGLREAVERWAEEMAHKAFDAHHSIQRASDRLAELVSLAAQRVIEVEDRDGLYRRALRSMRGLTGDSKTLTLHIGHEDAAYARSVVGQLAEEIGVPVPLDIKVDERLTAGGCVLESDYGVIDASLGLQIEAVKLAIGRAARAALARMDDGIVPPGRQAEPEGEATHEP